MKEESSTIRLQKPFVRVYFLQWLHVLATSGSITKLWWIVSSPRESLLVVGERALHSLRRRNLDLSSLSLIDSLLAVALTSVNSALSCRSLPTLSKLPILSQRSQVPGYPITLMSLLLEDSLIGTTWWWGAQCNCPKPELWSQSQTWISGSRMWREGSSAILSLPEVTSATVPVSSQVQADLRFRKDSLPVKSQKLERY